MRLKAKREVDPVAQRKASARAFLRRGAAKEGRPDVRDVRTSTSAHRPIFAYSEDEAYVEKAELKVPRRQGRDAEHGKKTPAPQPSRLLFP